MPSNVVGRNEALEKFHLRRQQPVTGWGGCCLRCRREFERSEFEQRIELLARVPGSEPVGHITACGALWPVLGELKDAHATRDAFRETRGGLGVGVPGRIMIRDDDMSAPRRASLCSGRHFGRWPGLAAPSGLQVAGMPMRHKASTSFSPSTTAMVWSCPSASFTSGKR